MGSTWLRPAGGGARGNRGACPEGKVDSAAQGFDEDGNFTYEIGEQTVGAPMVAFKAWISFACSAALSIASMKRIRRRSGDAFDRAFVHCSSRLLLLIGHRIPTEGAWVQFKKPVLEDMPVLDVRQLSSEQLDLLAHAYDNLATTQLEPLPAMATDQTRQAIDEAIREALGLQSFREITGLLAREPVVANTSLVKTEPELEIEEQLALF